MANSIENYEQKSTQVWHYFLDYLEAFLLHRASIRLRGHKDQHRTKGTITAS